MIFIENPVFDLPAIDMIGGSTETFQWNLWYVEPGGHENKSNPFNTVNHKVIFSVVPYSSKNEIPSIYKECDTEEDSQGIPSVATITLVPSDTKSLEGKFLYQLSIQKGNANSETVRQGVLHIWRNLNKLLFSESAPAEIPILKAD